MRIASVFLDSTYYPYIKCLNCNHNNAITDMYKDTFNWTGFLFRLLFALGLVYSTYNPDGYSYYHWIQASFNHTETGLLGSNALKFVAGILLLTGWLIYLNATRESLGIAGVCLILALCGGLIWFFADIGLFEPSNVRIIERLTELVIAFILAVGMSWSHIRRRLTGQIDIDER